MPKYSIRTKILIIVLVFIGIIGAAFVIYSIKTAANYKLLRLESIENTVAFETERINKIVIELEQGAIFYAMGGMLIYQSNSEELIEKFATELLSSLPAAEGGGLWFEPHASENGKLRAGFYAFKDDAGRIKLDDTIALDKYDYHNTNWYREIKEFAVNQYDVVWTRPYTDDSGSFSLMTTVGASVFDADGKLIAISSVDWKIDDVIEELISVKPTENSFVFLSIPEKDYVISSTRTRSVIGASMGSIPWDITADKFELNGVTYLRFSRYIDNGLYMSIQIPENEIFEEMESQNSRFLALAAIISVLMFALAYILLSVYINSPIKELTSGVSQLALGNLDTRIKISSADELGLLAQVFNKMTKDLKKTIMENVREHAEKEKISAELNIAANIQTSMIPSVFPPFPNRTEFDLYASMIPAKEVGGDFYDFYLVKEDNLAVIIADVSGKGIPAALFMVIAKTLIENSSSSLSPKRVFEKVNKRLLKNNEAGMFVTAFMGIYNIPTGKFIFSNAGHNPPALKRKDGDYELLVKKPCMVLGCMEEAKFAEYETTLEKGDIIYLYTDGVTEAMNQKKELFSEERLLDTLNQNKDKSPKELINAVKRTIDKFIDMGEQADDMTMLALEINHDENEKSKSSKQDYVVNELRVAAVTENLDKVMEFVNEHLNKCNFSDEYLSAIIIAVEEIFTNIVNYAYKPDSGEAAVFISTGDKVTIMFEDTGKPYNPLEQEDPDLEKSAAEREIGGMGVYLVKKLMDNVVYSRIDDKNVLVITKNNP